MTTISRDDLHRVVELLPDDRLTAAAELLESLALHDARVRLWLQDLSRSDKSEIAVSLRCVHTTDEWVTDETVAAWIDSVAEGNDPAP